MCWLNTAHAAEFTAAVDRKEVMLNEHVEFTLKLANSDTRLRAEGVSPNIDLSTLTRDFDTGVPRVSNKYNIYQGRGRSTSELRVDLFPRHVGQLRIPAFTVDGLSTAPIEIQARATPPGFIPEFFSRAGVSKHRVWQREQFVAWLDVYHRIQLKTASVGEYIDTEPLRIELMEHRDLPQSERKEIVKGVSYDVTRIAWAIFPPQTGTLTVNLPDVWLVAADGRKLRLPFQKETVEVIALPAGVTKDIPVGKPAITQTAMQPAPSVSTVSSWTVTVRGPIGQFSLPDNLPLPPPPAGVKFYSDRARRDAETRVDGVTMLVNYTLSVQPQAARTYTLPPLRIPYFDTERGALDIAELTFPDFTATGATAVPSVSPPTATVMYSTTLADSRPVENARPWQIAAGVFALLWLSTLTLLWRRTRMSHMTLQATVASASPPSPATAEHHPLQARLLDAFGSRTLEQGLEQWEATHGVDHQVRDTVRAVQRLCYGKSGNINTRALDTAVTIVISKIHSAAVKTHDAALDPWRAESFTIQPPRA